jgi:GT2 family glycosyltransferase
MQVTAVVVSWNTRELLLRCLRSLRPEVERGEVEAWVVDNGSSDGSAEAARAQAPWARVLEAPGNLGFGGAINLVARRTDSPWLLAANADVALEPGALDAMVRAGGAVQAGCVAPRLVLPDGSTQHSVYPFPTLPFTLVFNLGLYRLSARLADRLCLEGWWNPERPRPVPWAIGACVLIRREAFDAVGGFDERQWMYAEDLDLGWRLKQAGWMTWFEPVQVRHEAGAAARQAFGSDRRTRFQAATYAVLLRRRGAPRTWLTGALNIAGAAVRLAWMTPIAAVSSRHARVRQETRGWLKAHLRGLRHASTLAGPDDPGSRRAGA